MESPALRLISQTGNLGNQSYFLGNGLGSAFIGGGLQGVSNVLHGRPVDDNVLPTAALSGGLGCGGAATDEGLSLLRARLVC